MSKQSVIVLGLALILIVLIIAGIVLMQDARPEPEPFDPPAEAVTANNRGVGLMGRYEYDEARRIFEELVEQYPDWMEVRVNLAIATLNRQREGDEQKALEMLDKVLEIDPNHLRAHYCSGLLRLYLDEPDRAREHFRFVADRDPADAYAAYYVGQSYTQKREFEEALQWYTRSMEQDPYLRSAYYSMFQTLQRLDRHEEAMEMLEAFQRLEDNPRARLVEFVYTRMGPKGEARAIGVAEPVREPRPEGPVFREVMQLVALPEDAAWRTDWDGRAAAISAVEISGNEHIDLFIAEAVYLDDLRLNAIIINEGEGRFDIDLNHPLAWVENVNAALWGDYDNDGLTDVYFCRRGPNQLWNQVEPGEWEDVTEATGTAAGDYDTVDGMMFDADHAGALDIFLINADGPNELLNNNHDGTFRPLASDYGLTGDGRASRQILPVDVERDRDLDLFVVNDEPPHEMYINDRLWQYRPAPDEAVGFDALLDSPMLAAVAGDLDADGQMEIYTLDEAGRVQRWTPDRDGVWSSREVLDVRTALEAEPAVGPRAHLALADVTGDGVLNLILSTRDGWAVFDISEDGPQRIDSAEKPGLIGWTVALFEPAAGPSIVGFSAGDPMHGGPVAWQPGPGRHPFVALDFTGKEDPGQSMRSNASGIGTHFAVRVGSHWTAGHTLRHHSGPGQNLQPVAIGLGGAERLDFVAIDWSDGIFQSEIDLAAGERHLITETQRKLASCPVLFAWNGERYEFVSDVLGVGGIGFAAGPPGEYLPSRPWERFLFPQGILQPKDGRYVLKLAEPMEEACYLDSARLVMYDVPPGWSITIDERMHISGPGPTGKTLFYREIIAPSHATNDRGEDITAVVREPNLEAAPIPDRDVRFIGRLQRDHVLTLQFDPALDEAPGQPHLIANGWIEYPYSQTVFAAWQAGADYRAPTVEARGYDGEWRTVLEEFGYPAGMPRQMAVPLENLPEGTREIRITTNQEIYWDYLAVAYVEESPDRVRREQLDLVAATLIRSGFAQHVELPQRRPYYDYDRRLPFWDTRHQAGYYTRFGPVEEFIREPNNALAIFGPGEEIHMEFRASRTALPDGWRRYYVFETDGWCKDMDLFTRYGATLEPLPKREGEPTDERRRLHETYNTRYRSGH